MAWFSSSNCLMSIADMSRFAFSLSLELFTLNSFYIMSLEIKQKTTVLLIYIFYCDFFLNSHVLGHMLE